MKLGCQKLFLLAAVLSVACHDAAGPRITPAGCGDIAAVAVTPIGCFTLTSINGRALPTFFSPAPDAPTVLNGSLYLDGAGHATIREWRRDLTGNVVEYTTPYTYVITGNTVHFDYEHPCPPDAICAGPPTGVITGIHLILDFSGGTGDLIYDYAQYMLD